MKKTLLLLLLATFSIQAQTLQNPTYGNVKLKNNTTDNSATKVNVQSTDGTINTISKSDLVNVVEVNDVPTLPLVGEVGKIYVVKNVNKIYRWNGTFYQELAGSDISGKEDIANKQNSLSVDGSNTKYPTVTAVNTGLALKSNDNAVVHLTGTETITGVKTFNDISAVTNYKSSTSNVIISDTDGLVFRGVRSGAWSDSVNTRFFQVGNSNDNVAFTTRFGSAANRMLFSSLKTQISSGNFASTIVPLGIFEVTNGTNRFFNVFESGNSVFGGSTDDLTNRLQVTGTVSSGTTALGNTPPTANNQLTRKDYVDTGLALKANLASPALTGTPTAPTATAGANTTQIATTAFVTGADAGNVKLTGNQTISGQKSFSLTGKIDMQTNDPFPAIKVTALGSNGSSAVVFFNGSSSPYSSALKLQTGTSGGVGNMTLDVSNSSPIGTGIFSNASNGGVSISSESSNGDSYISNITYGGTGRNYVGRNNGTETYSVDKTGNVIGNSYIKRSTPTTNILLAGGGDIAQNTAFNKNFGTTAGTVVEGGTLGSNAYTSTAYLPLSGGTLSGALNGTSANFSGIGSFGEGFAGPLLRAYNSNLGENANISISVGKLAAVNNSGFLVWQNDVIPSNRYLSLETFSGANPLRINASNFNVTTSGAATFSSSVTAASYTATSLPVFENNAAASSLAVGQFYRTSTGVLMVKF